MLVILLPLKALAKWTKYDLLRVTAAEEADGIDYHYHTYQKGYFDNRVVTVSQPDQERDNIN